MRSKIVAIVEARMFSARLPGKEMRQIIGRPMLELLIERLKRAEKIDEIIIATTRSPEDTAIIELAKGMDIQFFQGSSEDVLDRVLQAAKTYHGDIIVIITGDNPLLDPLLIDKIIQIYLDNTFDYVSNGIKRTYPWGLRVQVFSTKILQEISELTNDPTDREHITPYIYEHPEKYKLQNIEAPPELHYPDYRWTVDYAEDLRFVRKVYESLYPKNPNFSIKDIINLLKAKPELIEINAHREQKLLHMELSHCRQFFGARPATISRLRKLYNSRFFNNAEKEKQREQMYVQEFERLQRYFDLKKGGNVLDIGCGTGGFLQLFGRRWQKFGIEVSDFASSMAKNRGIILDFELRDEFFDLIIFRGTIQHLPDPVNRIDECYYWLKNSGGLIFLATPNINSIYYKLFNTLPALDSARNFLLPSDLILRQILENFQFKIKGFEYPYRNSPYASPFQDWCLFILKLAGIKRKAQFPFYRNMLECYAIKEISQ